MHKVKKMEMGHSPAEELFDELIIRACTLQHFKELLRFASLTNILALISEPGIAWELLFYSIMPLR